MYAVSRMQTVKQCKSDKLGARLPKRLSAADVLRLSLSLLFHHSTIRIHYHLAFDPSLRKLRSIPFEHLQLFFSTILLRRCHF